MNLDAGLRKKILGALTYGVYVLTAEREGDFHASTVTWVSQVSFEPPLVMVAVRRESLMYVYVTTTGRFGLHILDKGQQDMAARFFKKPLVESDTIGGVPFRPGKTGVPVLIPAPAALECEVRSVTLLGDHAVVIGEVQHLHLNPDRSETDIAPLRLHETPWKYSG